MKTLKSLKRCPKCKSADIIEYGHLTWNWQCVACGEKFMDPPGCQHKLLKRTRSGACETDFYKCAECKRNFTAEPLTIKVSSSGELACAAGEPQQ